MSVRLVVVLVALCVVAEVAWCRRRDDRTKCPEVRATPHFDLPQMLGAWYVVEYYASAEEALSYSCMRAVFTQEDHVYGADGSVDWTPGVTMNFTYEFADDPLKKALLGNITWRIDLAEPAHWTHAEKTYAGVYNTYVLDTEYKTWALLLHCAEQREETRYLSAFVLSRNTTLRGNVLAYLRDKLPRYQVDVPYVFPIPHTSCAPRSARARYADDAPILVDLEHKAQVADAAGLSVVGGDQYKDDQVDVRYVFPIPHTSCAPRSARARYADDAPILVDLEHKAQVADAAGFSVGGDQYKVDDGLGDDRGKLDGGAMVDQIDDFND